MVEVKARGDEESNIGWARTLEQSGVHVSYGMVGLKTHCKMTLIVRREVDGLRRYAHLGTGNYNAQTARLYTDLGIFTADPDICADVSDLFNYLTGYSAQREFRKLIVAPMNLRRQVVELIEREAAHGAARATDLQDECADRCGDDRGPVPRLARGRGDRLADPRGLLPASRACPASARRSG